MKLCADATTRELETGLAALGPAPQHQIVRAPEIGLVMLRGRMGGDGAPFNLGEATVTRAAIRLSSGEIGFSCVLGRDGEKARLAALIDALGQRDEFLEALDARLAAPIRERLAREGTVKIAQTAATRVNFFTLVRGED
ncbi:MAG: phosphonate C-P lyase system protein PhnG [Beijerinckiaceae bacterium]|nr:phosphonate C-P lyase system protein PhnG [Beijerinckiaceae bacterium]